MWTFIIDTDSYAGNFERDMCAFMTGRVGECGVGGDFADLFLAEIYADRDDDVNHHIIEQPDDHGTRRPCVICPTPGFFNDGMGNEYPDSTLEIAAGRKKVTDKLIRAHRKYHKDYGTDPTQDIDEVRNRSEVQQCPSYQSVGIFMDRPPTDEEVAVLIKRAKLFPKVRKKQKGILYADEKIIKILGFRLVRETTTETLEKSWCMTKPKPEKTND